MLGSIFGGVNKWRRNWAAREGHTEFEKVSIRYHSSQRLIKVTYSGDEKEPKQKHVICMT